MVRTALDLTYVLYDETSHVSHLLALLTLSPILLNPAYAVLAVQTRELVYVEMWAGQLLCEVFNWFLKEIIREERPNVDMGQGYGFPSSHSQWMGYFAAFLLCHFNFRHRFVSTGWKFLDYLWKTTLYLGVATWATSVAYSRYHLAYHTISQVGWGFSIGLLFGVAYYTVVEIIPAKRPDSFLGRVRTAALAHPVVVWSRIRDSWAVWPDGGLENQYYRWRDALNHERLVSGRPNADKKLH